MMEESINAEIRIYAIARSRPSQIKINSLPTDKNPPMMNVSKTI